MTIGGSGFSFPSLDCSPLMKIPVFATPERLSLSGDIPLYVLRSECQPAVRIDVVIDSGQAVQDKLLQAIFTNRMLREGTGNMSSAAIAERLDSLGSWLELSVSMGCSFLTLYSLLRCLRPSCEILRNILLDPVFPEDQLAIICTNNRQQHLVNSRRGDVVARRMLYEKIYGSEHPCGRFAEAPDFDAVTCDDLLRYYRSHYVADNASLYIVGDVNDEVLSIVDSCFGDWHSSSRLDSSLSAVPSIRPDTGPHTSIVHHMSTQAQASIRMGCLMMDAGTVDYYRMRVVSTLLGGFFGSRLMKRIREDLGYTYGISCDLITNTRQVLFVISSEAVADKADEMINEVYREMERLCCDLVPDDELTSTRNYMLGEVCRSYESPFSLIDAYIYTHTLGLPEEHIPITVRTAFDITAQQLRETACRWLRLDAMHCVKVLP